MKVGDYVRTEKGTITKFNIHDILLNKFENRYYYTYDTCCEDSVSELVIKSSPNIIDLIEYGDIVKYKIDDEEFISEVWGEKNDYFVQNFDVPIDLRDLNIVSIVTKEQFESMKYEVNK